MTVRLKPTLPPRPRRPILSSLSIEKFLKSHKNLSKPPPRLWPHDPIPNPYPNPSPNPNPNNHPILTLNHPLFCTLQSCGSINQFNQVHTQFIVAGLSQYPLCTSQVVKKLCSLGEVHHGVLFFRSIEEPDAFLCNSIMRCYFNLNEPLRAFDFYYQFMLGRCVLPNHYTFPIVIKVCVEIGLVFEGEKAHCQVVKFGFESDLFVRNSLIHMYSVFGRIGSARVVFDSGFVMDLVSWNSMIDGYVKCGEVDIAGELFDEMPEKDTFSWNSMIAGYVGSGNLEAARSLFERMQSRDVVSWNCMIDGYARSGDITMACELFNEMPSRNVVSWNTMLALYVRCKNYEECLKLFDTMMEEKTIKPNGACLVSVLTACTNMGDLDRGKSLHCYINSNGIKPDVLLSTALLTMYFKCGAMDLARDVFEGMLEKNVVSWNAMIMGYGMYGQGDKALDMFAQMEKASIIPNEATFICILSACTHAGMILEGWWYFNLMYRVYNIEPKAEHYGCMVDLLARAGLMKDSAELIKKIPMEAGPALWGALLSACRSHSNTELGEIVAKRLIEMEPMDIGPYVLLSNMYAAEGNWNAVENVRLMMKERGLQKEAGSSMVHHGSVELGSSMAKVSSHRKNMIYSLLSEIGSQMKSSLNREGI